MRQGFLLARGVPGERRGIIEAHVDDVGLSREVRAALVGVSANGHDVIEGDVPQFLNGLRVLAGDVDPGFSHHLNGLRVQAVGLDARRVGLHRDAAREPEHECRSKIVSPRQVWFAELVGTFALVFVGTGAIIVDGVSGGKITHVGIALTFGLVVLAMIYTLGDVSGAHLNPAVTLGFAAAGRMPPGRVPLYISAQCLGALLASGALRALFPTSASLGETLPTGTPLQSFGLELLLTWLLMLAILRVSTGAKEKGITAGICIGAVIALEALFGGPISGASMNPARSLAPALVSGHLQALWVYMAAPVLGAFLAFPTCAGMSAPGCCGRSAADD